MVTIYFVIGIMSECCLRTGKTSPVVLTCLIIEIVRCP